MKIQHKIFLDQTLYYINATLVKGGFFSTETTIKGYLWRNNNLFTYKIFIDENNTIHINPRLKDISYIEEITKDNSKYDWFFNFLEQNNLTIRKTSKETTYGLLSKTSVKQITHYLGVYFKNPLDVKFYHKGNILSYDDVKDMVLPPDKAFQTHYDNGYSCISSTPITKAQFLANALKMLQEPFSWSKYGLSISNPKPNTFCIDVWIGDNREYYEISNS